MHLISKSSALFPLWTQFTVTLTNCFFFEEVKQNNDGDLIGLYYEMEILYRISKLEEYFEWACVLKQSM